MRQRLLSGAVRSAPTTRDHAFRRCRRPETGAAGHPLKNVRLEPPNFLAAESLFSRKLPDRRHAAKHPWRSPDEPSDIVGGENLIPCRVGFIHPPGDRDSLTYADAARLDVVLNRICRHKRPSMWFRSFRVKLSRMARSCALCQVEWCESFAENSAKLSQHAVLTHELGEDLAGVDLERPR